jgi:hypothetical protein
MVRATGAGTGLNAASITTMGHGRRANRDRGGDAAHLSGQAHADTIAEAATRLWLHLLEIICGSLAAVSERSQRVAVRWGQPTEAVLERSRRGARKTPAGHSEETGPEHCRAVNSGTPKSPCRRIAPCRSQPACYLARRPA